MTLQSIYLMLLFGFRWSHLFVSVLALLAISHAHIYTSPPTVTYNNYGYPLSYSIYFSLELGQGASDYLLVYWSEQIYVTAKSQVQGVLISYGNNLQIASVYATVDGLASNILSFTFGYALAANTWYQVQIFPTKNPVASSGDYLIQLISASTYLANNIIYDSNMALGYVDILAPLASNNTMAIICNSTSSQYNIPAAIYSFDIYITPTVTSTTGGNFTFSIYYDSNNAIMNVTGTSIIDFSFMGLCQSAATNSAAAAVLLNCAISSDLSTITFSMASVTAGSTIRISTSISNPPYYSIRGIRGYWTEFISGRVLENGYLVSALSVSKIAIGLIPLNSGRIYLYWGIDKDYTDSTITSNTMALFKAAGTNVGPYNSFNIGFTFTQTSPISGRYTVKMTLGATGMLEGSIAHNLPSYNAMTVVCSYDTVNFQIVCINVGAFINTGYRYFISGKAYYGSSTSSTLSTFGDVQIYPIVYDSNGNLLSNAVLYTPLVSGQSIQVQTSQDFLDISGYHSTASYSIGNAQIVSYYDDETLSSTANAIQGFLQGSNSSVGIIPDLGTSQQLLMLLKVPTTSMSTAAQSTNKTFLTQVMFNNQIVGFQSTAAGRGLDFVGYQNSSGNWSISYSSCYFSTVVCQKYNNNTPTINTKTLVNQTSTTNFYGMFNFYCGEKYVASPACSTNCKEQCAIFTGLGTADQASGVMSIRQVTFPSGYHSSIYADNTLLDFLLIFTHGTTIVSYSLINAFTLSGARLQNIKASYVNYYDNSASSAYNKGVRVPTMLRIGGGILPSQSLSATVIGVFFDDNIDASTFYTSTGQSFAVGCSTSNCQYFPNKGLNNPRNDNWHTNRRVLFYSIPPIQNEFNLLVPVTPDTTNRAPPKYLTIAFFTQNYTVNGVSGLLQTMRVFRIYGPVVAGSVVGGLTTINGLARVTAGPDLQFTANSYAVSGGLSIALNTTNMYSNPLNNTFTYGNADIPTVLGSYFGCGVTITSFFYNIFASSTVAYDQPPSNTATTCSLFGYVYNELQSPGSNAYKNGQWIYVAFCPVDSYFNFQTTAANIDFLNPQYPTILTNNFPLQSLLTYAYSNQYGYLRSYRKQTNSISTLIRTCTTSKLQTYNPSSAGKQRAWFTVSIPAITLSTASAYNGYTSFYVQVVIPSSTVASSNLVMSNSQCDVSLSTLSCSVVSGGGSASTTVKLTYLGTSITTVTYFQVGLYATVSGTFSTAAAYTLNIFLPQYISDYVPFGSSYGSQTSYCTCTSSFTVGITAYGTNMTFTTPALQTSSMAIHSPITFNFGASSYQPTFFTSSYFQFNFGFLTDPASTYYSRSNLRCLIYQNNGGTLTLSSLWKTFTLGSLSSAVLTPKAQISSPSNIVFTMNCLGSAVPTGSNTTAMGLTWSDSLPATVQTATSVTYPGTYTSLPGGSITITISYKRFKTQGFKSLYSFAITSSSALTTNSRLYFDFHMKMSSRLDNQGVVECYTRTASAIVDTAAVYAYCAFVNPWQLILWNNVAIAAGVTYYVDIFNVDQPKSTDIGANQYIYVTLDSDSNFQNGVIAVGSVQDNSVAVLPKATADMTILTATLSTVYIRTAQTITISFDAGTTAVFTGGNKLYVLFPSSYSQWITRGSIISTSNCNLVNTGQTTNLATACSYISQRILQITVSSITQRLYTLTLTGIMSPSTLPTGKYNQFRFKLFLADAAQSAITYYTFTDYSAALSLTTNPALIDLSWYYENITTTGSLFNIIPITGVTTIQIGYYSSVIELRQALYPANFQTSMTLTLNTFVNGSFYCLGGSMIVNLGTATAYFRLAANSSISPGLYTLYYTKTGDTNSLYTNIPPLTLVVQNSQCALTTDSLTYLLPLGGSTLPIYIDAIRCIPINNITLSLSFTSPQISVNNDLSSLKLLSSSIDGKLYIVLKHTLGSLTIGSTVTVTFTIGGDNAGSYATIPQIQLTLVDPTTYQIYPTATALSAPTLSTNKATFTMQCSQASTIYWGLGIYPSILNTVALDLQARIISGSNGLLTNFTQNSDYYGRVYGVNTGTTMQVVSLTLYQLKSNVNYIFKYYCQNQLGLISDSQSINFTSLNYGAYLMKTTITFRSSITYGQYNALACSLAQNFMIPYWRVMTQAMSTCSNISYTFYQNDSSPVLDQADSSGNYNYNFYILPDYTQSADQTNANIRSSLSLNSFTTTIITSTANYLTLPSLVQIQTQDIQIYTTPAMTLGTPLSGLTSVVVSGSITNMNGFIVVGVYQGIFTPTNQTLPTATLIKSGYFSTNVTLLAVQMIYATQNYNVTLSFPSLTQNTNYTLFYFCTSQDPQYTSLSSTVSYIQVQTLTALVININWNARDSIGVLALLVILFMAS